MIYTSLPPDTLKIPHLRKTLRILSGLGLVIIGIIGLIMPIMPGWVFLIPGLVILAEYFPPVRRLLDWAKRMYEKQKSRQAE